MAYNSEDPKQIAAAKKSAEKAIALRLNVIKNIMQTIPGRAWIYTLLERCHIYHTPFLAGQPDVTAFQCGEQNIGNQLLADVQAAAPELYIQMIAEAKS